MMLAPIGLIMVLTLLSVIAFSFAGRNRVNMGDSIALAIIGVCVAIVSYALIQQEGFALNDFLRRPGTEIHWLRPDVKVWVDTQNGLYYCSGAKEFGHGKNGRYTTQQQAQRDYYKPALGEPCK